MIKLDLNNLFNISPDHGVSESGFQNAENHISDFLKKIEARSQDFYKVIDDGEMVEQIEAFAKSVEGKYDDIVVLGTGGSALGTITLRDSLSHLFKSSHPRLHILENIDPDMTEEVLDVIDLAKTLFIPISKSGGTPETLAQYSFFRAKLEEAGLDVKDHMVFITDPEKGLFRKITDEEEITSFEVPPNVGGRFSVLTPVGLVPAALIGINIRELIQGAQEMRDMFLSEDFDTNLPFQLATTQYEALKKGKTQNVLMPYATKLRTFSAWFAQLLAESTGKVDIHGKNVGLTPIPALGITDQHSQTQLYAEGPNDKLLIFITVEKFKKDSEIPIKGTNEKTDFLKGVSFGKLLATEHKATANALAEGNRPNITIQVPEISEKVLGELFLLFEGATAFLGEYLEINAFDQPGVERSKILTREYLSS